MSTHFRNLAGFLIFLVVSNFVRPAKYYIIHEAIFALRCDWLKSDSSASRHLKIKILFFARFSGCGISEKIKLINLLFLHLIFLTAVFPLPPLPPPVCNLCYKKNENPLSSFVCLSIAMSVVPLPCLPNIPSLSAFDNLLILMVGSLNQCSVSASVL